MAMGKLLGTFAFDLYGKHRLRLQPGRAVPRLRASCAGSSTRRSASRCAACARTCKRMPAIGAPVGKRLVAVYTRRRGDRRRRRRAARADDAVRRARRLRLPALGRPDDHAGAGRHRPALRRASSARPCSWSRTTTLSDLNPIYWQFWLGLLLVVVVLFARGGILGALDGLPRAPAREAAVTAALRTEGLGKHFGAFTANSDVSLVVPARRAACADRPERRRQDDVHQPADRRAGADRRATCLLGDEHITGLPQHQRVKRGMTRTFQINTLFAGLTVLESVVLAVCERKGRAAIWHRTVASRREEVDEARALLDTLRLARRRRHAHAQPALRQAAAGRDRAGARHEAAHPAARRAGRGHPGGRERANCSA